MEQNYSEAYFGKPLSGIDIDDLVHFFSFEQEESDTIEFKSYYEKNQTNHTHKEAVVLKTICGFLNSGGGLLIWGAPIGEKSDGRIVKVFVGDLSPVETLMEKDQFVSKIANRIIPISNLIKMKCIKVETGKYVYIFEVAQSLYKPHQFDNRYWVRLDGQTAVAPHYLIDALFKQISYPNIGGYIKFGECRVLNECLILRSCTTNIG